MNIAILIDAENIDPAYAEQIFTFAESRGTIVAREIYGAGIALNRWSDAILQYALHTNMTLKPNRFKNSTDIALVIGAMDLLLERNAYGTTSERDTTAETVIIASSDSDYSALALRLRTSGIYVIGIGEKGCINPSWPMACSEFIAFTPPDEVRQEGQSTSRATAAQKTNNQPAAYGTNDSSARRSHNDRVANIRKFIADQLSKNNGQMASSALFNLLHELPDYIYDQQRSKRSPVEYLNRQYSDLLKIRKNSDGALWVYSKLTDIADGSKTEGRSVAAPKQDAPPDVESTSLSLMDFLCGAGLDGTDAQTVSSVYEKCSNMRDVYNVLRKTFKTGTGSAYYQLVKQHRESQKQTQ